MNALSVRPLLAGLAAALALAGCGGGGESGPDTAVADSAPPAASSAPGPTPSASGEQSATPRSDTPLRFVYSSGNAVWTVGLQGPPKRLAKLDALLGLAVSPDGRTIAIAPDGTGLHFVGIDGKGLREVDGSLVGHDAFSPDGRTIAALRGTGFYLLDLEGPGARRLSYDSPDHAQFHPGGRYVAAMRDNLIETFPVDGGPPTKILTTERAFKHFAFSPDGKRIVYGVELNDDFDSDLYVANSDGTEPRRLTTTGDAAVASWSPDGTTLAFHRGSEGGVWTIRADGSALRRVGAKGSYPVFSPDGQWIAFARNPSGIRVVRLDGSGGKTVGKGHADTFVVVPSP
ncbi:MAG: hypothetical protein ACT4QG_20705 [Sporichthyaceae bacterium]